MTTTPPSPEPVSGPPTPAPQKTPKPHKRGAWLIALAALAVSLLSLVVAVASIVSARTARDEAADAERLAEALAPANAGGPTPVASDPVATPTTGAPPPTGGPEGTEASPQTLNPQAEFTVRYSGEVLNPQVTGSDEAYIDLDEPRVVFNVGEADLVLEEDGFGSDPPYFDLQQSNVTVAETGAPEATPEDCLERIRTSPLPPGAEVPAQRGTVLCALTSLGRAAEQGISQKLVVLHVSALGDDGRVTVEVNAWDQPQ